MEANLHHSIGKRIVDKLKQRKGTIRWIGSLPINNDTDEEWLGIEWDKPEDGTHRGEYKGVRYFECTSSTSTASFLKLSKVDFGISFLHAVSLKYDASNIHISNSSTLVEDANKKEEAAYVLTQEGRKVLIEFVGEEKAKEISSQIADKLIISLPSSNLSHSYSQQETPLTFQRIRELELSDNLLNDWVEISRITHHMSTLQSLNLSKNFLLSQSLLHPSIFPFPTSLTTLVLNRVNLNWHDLNILQEKFGETVEELHVSYNSFSKCEIEMKPWNALKLLNFEGNFIHDWNNLKSAIGHFPNLSKLLLSHTPLTSILPFTQTNISNNNNNNDIISNNDDHGGGEFQNLTSLVISNTQINDWISINHLNSYPNLKDLIIMNSSLYNQNFSPSIIRLLTIGRIRSLLTLNRSVISSEERQNAEKYYLKTIHSNVIERFQLSPSSDISEFRKIATDLQTHPQHQFTFDRYFELLDAHGLPDISSHSNRSVYIELIIWSEFDSDVTKKIPHNTTIGKLKLMISYLFSVKPSEQKIYHQTKKGELNIEELDDDERTLEYYGISGGCIFVKYDISIAEENARNQQSDPYTPVLY